MRPLLLASLTVLPFAACTSSGGSGDDTGTYNCAMDTRGEEFVVGLEKPGDNGSLDFHLMSSDPAPPGRGDNTWVVKINAMSAGVDGSPANEATVTVTPYMPDHNHVSPKTVLVSPMDTNGDYQLAPVNLWMPGVWETTIDVESPAGNDKVVYTFCIPS